MDVDGLAIIVKTFAGSVAAGFILRKNADIHLRIVVGATGELHIGAIETAIAGAFDSVLVGVGVVCLAVVIINDGAVLGSGMAIEALAGAAGSARVVVDANQQIVGTGVFEGGIENKLIPTLNKMEGTFVYLGHLASGDQGCRIVEMIDGNIGQIDSAVFLIEGGGVGVVVMDGTDAFSTIEFVGTIDTLRAVVVVVVHKGNGIVVLDGVPTHGIGSGVVAEFGVERYYLR